MDISNNLISHEGNKYIYSIHSTPLNYCEKLMSAGSRGGRVAFKSDGLQVKSESTFYSWRDVKRYTESSVEAYYIYYDSRVIMLDVLKNEMIINCSNPDYILRVLDIVHTNDFNTEEVWKDLVERVRI